ncbi:MAG: tRNA 5'-guanylyltransferase [Thaumarchaeota archaeon]|nr:tRNA 5'-guanylyltransferase [Nitrososphaerota archaeon]
MRNNPYTALPIFYSMQRKHLWERLGLPAPKSEASTGRLSLIDYEVYSGLEVSRSPFFVRLDGWAFHSLTEKMRLKKPFDSRLVRALAASAKSLFFEFNPILCYVFSDEVNFLFSRPTVFRRIEKIDSVLASSFSSCFSRKTNTLAAFDSRVIPLGRRNVRSYLIWRQAECIRNYFNAWAQHTLVKIVGLSPREASQELSGLKVPSLIQLCKNHGVDVRKMPRWQQRGVLLHFEDYTKKGYNPMTKKHVVVKRRRVATEWNLPAFDTVEGRESIRAIIER